MTIVYSKISVKPKTKEMFHKCYNEFLKHHPEVTADQLTEDFMQEKICRYYLENG